MRPVGKQNQQRRDGDQGGLKVRSSKSVPQGQGDRRQSQHGKGPQGSKPAATATKPEEKPSADIATLETVFDGAVAKTDEKPVVTSAAPVVA